MVALACGQSSPAGIAVRNGIVYWVNNVAGGSVMSVPATGGVPTTIASNQDYPWAVAVDGNNVYWTNYDGASAIFVGTPTNAGTVMEVPLGGGTPVTLASALQGPWGIAVDAANVYFTTAGGNKVKSVPIDSGGNGPVTILAEDQYTPTAIAVDASNVYWVNESEVSSSNFGAVMSVPKDSDGGVAPTVIVQPGATYDTPTGLAVNAASVFFTNNVDSGDVESAPLGGGAPPTVLASGQINPFSITLDENNVYWTNNSASTGGGQGSGADSVASIPLDGGAVTQLATKLNGPTGIAVDSNALYFTTYIGNVGGAANEGRVWRLSLP